jgi:hypothetical protein
MALPLLVTPEFTTKIPSTGQEIEYRPFLVKEEKILFMALESGDQKDIIKAVKNTLKSCILSDIDLNKLTYFDLEHLFLQLRGKSVGEFLEFKIGHTNDSECQHKTDVTINLEDIHVQGLENVIDTIQLNDDLGMKMRYPGIDMFGQTENENDLESIMNLICSCVEFVYDQDEVYENFTKKELKDFIEQLSSKQFEELMNFFNTMPKLKKEVTFKCAKCGEEEEIIFEGLQDFFI